MINLLKEHALSQKLRELGISREIPSNNGSRWVEQEYDESSNDYKFNNFIPEEIEPEPNWKAVKRFSDSLD